MEDFRDLSVCLCMYFFNSNSVFKSVFDRILLGPKMCYTRDTFYSAEDSSSTSFSTSLQVFHGLVTDSCGGLCFLLFYNHFI